ncbi:MAG: TrkA-like protein [uncultured Thermomicrobiales bacterium]|uniref:Trk system potassium uptake protein TrkA n=1 Tax=uncultured Thermomicrobiales bacterium TaxID=1645740 RepID=A0A6J4VG58_9BACT|nr:MAG: TrkA-like protein [uncultured Thermomicrobiales bacterium]
MYIIVVGGGKVGYYLTKTLLEEGHEVLLIERSTDKVETFVEHFGAVVIAGDGAEAATLAAAGAARADVVIAVTGEDEDNLVVCQTARQKFHVGRTIARVNNPKNEHLFRLLGIDVTVSQTNYILNLIEQAIPERSFVHVLNLRHADLAIVEARIAASSVVAHKAIGEVALPVDCVIAAVARGAHLIIPTPATELEPGDDVIAVTRPEQEDELRRLLCIEC